MRLTAKQISQASQLLSWSTDKYYFFQKCINVLQSGHKLLCLELVSLLYWQSLKNAFVHPQRVDSEIKSQQ